MRQFIEGPNAAFEDLKHRAQGCCFQFHNQEMPPGSSPARARVGFEVNADNSAVVWVDKGVRYQGSNGSLISWFEAGCIQLPNFNALIKWIRLELGFAYHVCPAYDKVAPESTFRGRRIQGWTLDEADIDFLRSCNIFPS